MTDETARRCFDALVLVQSLASVMGGPLDDVRLYIEHAREANRNERPFSRICSSSRSQSPSCWSLAMPRSNCCSTPP